MREGVIQHVLRLYTFWLEFHPKYLQLCALVRSWVLGEGFSFSAANKREVCLSAPCGDLFEQVSQSSETEPPEDQYFI